MPGDIRSIWLVLASFAACGLAGSPAMAVSILNTDEEAHALFVCGDGCDGVLEPGKWIDIEPGETWAEICSHQCSILVLDGQDYQAQALSRSPVLFGDVVVHIKDGTLEKQPLENKVPAASLAPVGAPSVVAPGLAAPALNAPATSDARDTAP